MVEVQTSQVKSIMVARNEIERMINEGWNLIGFTFCEEHQENLYCMVFSQDRISL